MQIWLAVDSYEKTKRYAKRFSIPEEYFRASQSVDIIINRRSYRMFLKKDEAVSNIENPEEPILFVPIRPNSVHFAFELEHDLQNDSGWVVIGF